MSIKIGKSFWLNLEKVYGVSSLGQKVTLPDEEAQKMEESIKILQKYANDRVPLYGINTQVGDDAYRVNLKSEDYEDSLIRRQANAMRALGCGLGQDCSDEIIRATLLLRANAHVQGASGVRPLVTEGILKLVNEDILPVIKRYGSVGASGDLIPMSSIGRTLMAEHMVKYKGSIVHAKDVFKVLGIEPIQLHMKEGVAIVNGTSFTTAIAAIAIHKLCYYLPLSISATVACCEAMLAMDSSYDPYLHEAKHHKGQIEVAAFIRECWEGSSMVRSLSKLREKWKASLVSEEISNQEHVQDFYSLRGIAHGFGPFAENLERAVSVVEEEMNSVNDNPIVDIKNGTVLHGANFLTDYIAVACDQLRADVAKASTWMHAIIGNLLHPRKNRGLPSNLVTNPEEYLGFKPVGVLMAAIAIHNRSRTLPVSAIMLPTEGDNQDMVSLGTHSAFDLLEVVENYSRMISIMLLAGAQALELRGLNEASHRSKKIHSFVRKYSSFVDKDRPLADDIEQINLFLDKSIHEIDFIQPWYLKNE